MKHLALAHAHCRSHARQTKMARPVRSRPAHDLVIVLIVVSLVWSPLVEPKPANEMASLDQLTKEAVVPDVIDSKPASALKVDWSSGVHAEQGNELKPTQVKDQPKITLEGHTKPDKLYLLAMVDPDAPSRKEPKLREIAHFMIANIPGSAIEKGDTVFEYIGSGAPQGTGLHRYIFLLYEQKHKLTGLSKTPKTSRQGRVNFSIRKFAKEHDLGEPLAANFFQAQYDDYVPLLHAQLNQG